MQEESERKGLKHIYFDKQINKYSNVGIGILARTFGFNLKVAYFNTKKNIFGLTFLFRNIKLENIQFFDYKSFNFNFFKDFDVLIFDDCDFSKFEKSEILKLIENKPEKVELIYVFSNKDEYSQVKDNFDLISEYKYMKNKKIDNKFTNITGNGKGKSTYCFGFLIRKLIELKRIKFVYFDKGGDKYGEKNLLKKLLKQNLDFELVSTGTERFDGKTFQYKNTSEDFDEAQKGLKEITDQSITKILIADELNTTIESGLLKLEEIKTLLENTSNELIISGRGAPQEILDLCANQIEVKEVKHYYKEGYKVRKGIDY